MTIQELYDSSIRALPAVERLQLATLILNEIPPQSVVDYREEWSDEDLADLTQHSWAQVEATLGAEADYA